MRSCFVIALILGLSALPPFVAPGSASADEPQPGAATNLSKQTLEIFRVRCAECHADKEPKGKLTLTDFEGVARGNKRGPVVSPGKPGESLLWEVVADDRMPPEEPLPQAERDILRKWIEQGAPGLKESRSRHWSFQPVVSPALPLVPQGIAIRNSVDRFVAAKLAERKLAFRQEASRTTLIRRVSFDLTGLPPTPEEIDLFLADRSATAYENMVDRYLASPRYGERWGKYWLDIAGYADSNGYFNADSHRPHAWRYRDYVISAFNRDKPYDEFVREQIAGDELSGYVPGGDVTPDMVERLTATHFLRNAPDGTGESDGNPDEVAIDRYTVIEGNLQITIHGLLGLTIQCAKCHSHKFEPISQEEYYRLQAILYSAYIPAKWVKPNDRVVTVATVTVREEHRRDNERLDRQIAAYKSSLERITLALREQVIEDRLENLSPPERSAVLEAVRLPADKLTAPQKELLKTHVEPLKITTEDIVKRFPEFAIERDQLQQAIATREKLRPRPLDTLAVLTDVDPAPPVHHVLLRGQHNMPGPEVAPGVLAIATTAKNPFQWEPLPETRRTTGRRLAFARWLTAPQNPLFARVMVNRVWQFHFGTGLVPTPDNFGQAGTPPTHPELLDFLTSEFVAQGWHLKPLHRLILTSATYRQGGEFDPAAARADPANHLWWRYPVRRLDAEAVRDAMLAVSGDLDTHLGGPCVMTTRADDGTIIVDPKSEGRLRRSVYLQQRRTQVMTFLELFDAPKIVTNCSFRSTSTVPLQSLALLNSDFIRERSVALSKRAAASAGDDLDLFIAHTFRLACGREPISREREASKQFVEAQRAIYGADPNSASQARTDFCQMLLASNAFLYVD
jgi:Protein of unknown function (DUF1553)/Protein of unknown function (DUF1549)/Planctomycete cytochrome C